jgi:F-type H+-transporting ATPase subunit epsilon
MHVSILTPDRHIFDGEADVVTLPGAEGSFQILDGHAPMIAILQKGSIEVNQKGTMMHFAATGGVVEVAAGTVSVLAESVVQ